jgi:hypothetical protein
MVKAKHDWTKLDLRIDQLKAQGVNDTDIARALGIGRQTLVDRLRRRQFMSTPTEDLGTPEHPGTLEAHQEVIEDIQESVPDAPHLGTVAAAQGIPEPPSTPEVHPELSPTGSGVPAEHSGVPARQAMAASVPVGHPSTPTAEDWELWTVIKSRWGEVEKFLADQRALFGTPRGTPRNTRKKTYVFDTRHIALIGRYAEVHRLERKDVLYQAIEEFFQRRGYAEGSDGLRP